MQLYVSTSTLPLQHHYNGHPHTNHFRHLGVRDVVRDDFGKFWKVPGIPFLDATARWNDPWGRWWEV